MIKWLKNLSKEGLQKLLFFGVLLMVVGVFVLAFSLDSGDTPIDTPNLPSDEPSDEPLDTDKENTNNKPIIEMFKVPCDLESYTVMRKYYSLDGTVEEQEMAVIQFGSKYFLSRGISLKGENDETFDVLASMSGVVSEVTESPIYGITVILDHGDGFSTEYISLSEATVTVGEEVSQGQKIGVSGKNEYDASASNHLHFKICKNGEYYNPLEILGKRKAEIQ